MRMRVAVMVVAACVCVIGAQQSPQNVPVFRTTTEMVGVDVTVLDKDHRPVHGLTAADFSVFEDGKPQTIAAFTAADFPDAVPPSAPWMRTASVDLVSNQVQQARLFVLVMDDMTVELDLASVKSAKDVAKAVVDKLGPSDRMAVVFTRDNRRAQDFTNDHQKLLTAIDTFSIGFVGRGGPNCEQMLMMLETLSDVAHYLDGVPDRRKVMIYVGEGVSIDLSAVAPLEVAPAGASSLPKGPGPQLAADSPTVNSRICDGVFSDRLSRLLDDAQRANVSVYPIDSCGLRGVSAPGSPSGGDAFGGSPQTCRTGGDEVMFLRGLAVATGGSAVVNTNDFTPGIDQIYRENASYYLLGYRRDGASDGHYHGIRVQVHRPGVEVRARTGYYAPNTKGIRAASVTAASGPGLTDALAGVMPKTDLPMNVTLAPFATADRKGATIVATIGVHPDIAGITTSASRPETVEVLSRAFTPEGSPRGSSTQESATLTVTRDADGTWRYDVLTALTLPPGRYSLRFAAHSQAAATTGSVYADVIVPNFEEDMISMSGIVLSATPALAKVSTNDLANLLPLTPSSQRVFATTDRVTGFLRVYQGGNSKPEAADVTVRVLDGANKTAFSQSHSLASTLFAGTARAADDQFALPIDRLKAGSYLLSVQVKANNHTTNRDVRFEVK